MLDYVGQFWYGWGVGVGGWAFGVTQQMFCCHWLVYPFSSLKLFCNIVFCNLGIVRKPSPPAPQTPTSSTTTAGTATTTTTKNTNFVDFFVKFSGCLWEGFSDYRVSTMDPPNCWLHPYFRCSVPWQHFSEHKSGTPLPSGVPMQQSNCWLDCTPVSAVPCLFWRLTAFLFQLSHALSVEYTLVSAIPCLVRLDDTLVSAVPCLIWLLTHSCFSCPMPCLTVDYTIVSANPSLVWLD